jgi:hypothetical protein
MYSIVVFVWQRAVAERILRQLQENPDTWTQVVTILQNSQNLNTKFYALQVIVQELLHAFLRYPKISENF